MATFTPRQTRFIEEYLVDGNATQAAIRAGYSRRSAAAQGHENLRKPEVWAEIERRRTALAARTEITAEWVLQRLAIEATREGEGASHGSRVTALTTLARTLGMFREKAEPEGGKSDRLELLLDEIGRRGSKVCVVE